MDAKVIIVDDHELVARGFAKCFTGREDYEILEVFTKPVDALNSIEILQPQLVISDLDMPGMNGLEMMQKAREISPQTKFILLTMHMSKQLYKKAKEQGIEGYLPKSTDEEELFVCVDQVLKGKTYYSQKLMDLLVSDVTHDTKSEHVIKYTQLLTDRERQILILVSEGYSSKEISDQLNVAVKTVETHRTNIMNKLEVHNVAGMVRIAMKEGLLG